MQVRVRVEGGIDDGSFQKRGGQERHFPVFLEVIKWSIPLEPESACHEHQTMIGGKNYSNSVRWP